MIHAAETTRSPTIKYGEVDFHATHWPSKYKMIDPHLVD